MSAFFLFDNIEVRDPEKLAEYASKAAPLVARYGGRYRSVGGATTVVEGSWTPVYPVIIEFGSAAAAMAWYESADYAPLKQLRKAAVDCNGVLIDEGAAITTTVAG